MFPITGAYKPYEFFLAPHSRNRVSASYNMPLVHDTVYAIRNDLTHTVLDFTGNAVRNLFGTPTLSPLAYSTYADPSIISYGLGMAWQK